MSVFTWGNETVDPNSLSTQGVVNQGVGIPAPAPNATITLPSGQVVPAPTGGVQYSYPNNPGYVNPATLNPAPAQGATNNSYGYSNGSPNGAYFTTPFNPSAPGGGSLTGSGQLNPNAGQGSGASGSLPPGANPMDPNVIAQWVQQQGLTSGADQSAESDPSYWVGVIQQQGGLTSANMGYFGGDIANPNSGGGGGSTAVGNYQPIAAFDYSGNPSTYSNYSAPQLTAPGAYSQGAPFNYATLNQGGQAPGAAPSPTTTGSPALGAGGTPAPGSAQNLQAGGQSVGNNVPGQGISNYTAPSAFGYSSTPQSYTAPDQFSYNATPQGFTANGQLSTPSPFTGSTVPTPSGYTPGTFTAPTAAEAEQDPGYQFALTQGETALQNSAASKGNLLTGGTAKAINDYAQQSAGTQYQNVYARDYNTFAGNEANQQAAYNLNTGYGLQAQNQGYTQAFNTNQANTTNLMNAQQGSYSNALSGYNANLTAQNQGFNQAQSGYQTNATTGLNAYNANLAAQAQGYGQAQGTYQTNATTGLNAYNANLAAQNQGFTQALGGYQANQSDALAAYQATTGAQLGAFSANASAGQNAASLNQTGNNQAWTNNYNAALQSYQMQLQQAQYQAGFGLSAANQNYNQALTTYNTNAGGFNTNQNTQYGRLTGLTGTGTTANNSLASSGGQYVDAAGNLITGGGNAAASGIVGSANATSAGVANGIQAANPFLAYGVTNLAKAQNSPFVPYGPGY